MPECHKETKVVVESVFNKITTAWEANLLALFLCFAGELYKNTMTSADDVTHSSWSLFHYSVLVLRLV